MSPAGIGARRLRTLLERHGVSPARPLGQNFVIDPNTIAKVVAAAQLGPGEHVLEIGAGGGSLTVALARAAGRVTAVEVDARLLPVLRETLAGCDNVTVVHGDARALDLNAFGAGALVANLPYNIAATVVLRVLESAPGIAALTVMTQREVGERLAAAPGSKVYGATSVLCALHARARVVAPVSRRAFFPAPNVDSVIVRLERTPPPAADPEAFRRVVKAAFSQRRKTLRNALAALAGSPDAAAAALVRAGLDPGARAEQVGPEGFAALARELA